MRKIFRQNEKGFTLIELMIVIAIIGILAAIAIPNFISYRNKGYCSNAEGEAKLITSAISDYFAIKEHTGLPQPGAGLPATPLSDGNAYGVTAVGGDPNTTITITVTDSSGRCPTGYQADVTGWDGSNVFTKIMAP